ncbi:MAG: M67 family metallopeptidase [Desulfobacterales bacterium]|nr:M67 family metallopeptidase [Desulfobacterales bacterium]
MRIKSSVLSGLIAHAKNDLPIEACGVLAEKNGVIVHQYRLKNVDASPTHFTLDPQEQFEAHRDMQKKGLKLAAVYHSHPATAARASQEDIKLAYDSGISYVIISLAEATEIIKSFKIRDQQAIAEEIVIIEG